MSYPPYCMLCGSKAHWGSDFDSSDYGYEVDGVVGVYTCSNEECGVMYEIIDFFIDDKEDQRVVKYSSFEDGCKVDDLAMVSSCLHCSSTLEENGCAPTSDVYGAEFECDGITTKLSCSKCDSTYDVVDLYPVDELYSDDILSIRDSRTIFLT